ncbi:MAG: Ig-like domain-containing protein, partial [Anaerolineales bacterium]
MLKRQFTAARITIFVLVLVSLACSVPVIGKVTPTPTITATVTPPAVTATPRADLPPALVETSPLPGSEIPLNGPIVFAFNQPMDQASVEAAFQSATGISGRFDWLDESTLWFYPDAALPVGTNLQLTIGTGAQAANGRGLLMPISVNFNTVGYLRLTQALPAPGARGANPAAAVVAAFNRPVVPLGAAPDELAPAFRLEPAAAGRGEWLNTSTYIFYPDGALSGGETYQVILDDDLAGVDGAPLDGIGIASDGSLPENQAFSEWSFSTAPPQTIGFTPSPEQPFGLQDPVSIQFNQPMNPDNVQGNFTLTGPEGNVAGQFGWDDGFTTLTFTPTNQLSRDTRYQVFLGGQTLSAGETPLGVDLAIQLTTVPEFRVVSTLPQEGGTMAPQGAARIVLSSPPPDGDLSGLIEVSPRLPNQYAYYSETEGLFVGGIFQAATQYTITLPGTLSDRWGEPLGEPFVLTFTTSDYMADLQVPGAYNSQVIFLTGQDRGLAARAVNIASAAVTSGAVSLDDFLQVMGSDNYYDQIRTYRPPAPTIQRTLLDLPRNQTRPITLPFNESGNPLAPGIYHIQLQSQSEFSPGPYFVIVSDVQLAFKLSPTDALVWAVRVDDLTPVADAPVTIYGARGEALASGQTDAQGLFQASLPAVEYSPDFDAYSARYAVLGTPGDENFSLALSSWEQGFASYSLGVNTDYRPPRLEAYAYTDRPIYRPGQTIYFRGVVREAFNGRYALPQIGSVPVRVSGNNLEPLAEMSLPLSEYGTASGEFELPAEAQPGYYSIDFGGDANWGSVSFRVASYRKPDINLQVQFAETDVPAGQALRGEAQATYFFGPPAADVTLNWILYREPDYFSLPGYQVGPQSPGFLEPQFFIPHVGFGSQVDNGQGVTDANGRFELPLNPDLPDAPGQGWSYTLEVTAQDESGLPVSARSQAVVHPASFYIGLRPATWNLRAGVAAPFEILTADWQKAASPGKNVSLSLYQVTFTAQEQPNQFLYPQFTEEASLVAQQTVQTDGQGKAQVEFTPPDPGTYRLTAEGSGARTDLYLWAGGEGSASWPDLPNERLELVADQERYLPGDTAHILIPNSLGRSAQALVSVERGTILDVQVVDVPASGASFTLDISEADAPNVYVTALLLAPQAYRYGLVELPVTPVAQELQVGLLSQPEVTGPGGEVSFELQVNDASGNPVQGEFSLAVVDKAVLALADPNSQNILEAYYGQQPLGVRTGISLAAYSGRQVIDIGGLGGGGGDLAVAGLPGLRQNFRDTAYWNGTIVTDAAGQAQVNVTLPDNLTTWQVEVRGLDDETRVGETRLDLLTTRDLLVRPVTPRFLVVGDHVQMAAVVQNNIDQELQVATSFQGQGFVLDDPGSANADITLPAGGRQRLTWWGTVQDVEAVDLLIVAEAGDLQDAVRVSQLPVKHFTTPQTFGTSGVMDSGGERLEVVSLPVSFDPQGGDLSLELSPSLGAAILTALDTLAPAPYASTEESISSFLPALEVYQALQTFGLEQPELKARLERTLDQQLTTLLATQNVDGGWNWWPIQGESDSYVTAYVLFGLARLQALGTEVPALTLQRAVDYLSANLGAPGLSTSVSELDRTAFEVFALAQLDESARERAMETAQALFEVRERLSPWSAAFLSLSFEPGSESAAEILSGLQAQAIRSATGVHWEDPEPDFRNFSSPIYTTSAVIYALAQRDPASSLLPDAVRYVMSHRSAGGGWASTYETSWTLLAMSEVMQGTGELAGDFSFSASVNDIPVAEATAGQDTRLTPVRAAVPVSNLYYRSPNAVVLERDPGTGRLYYNLHLEVQRPVEDVPPQEQGLSIQREYVPQGAACPQEPCEPVQGGQMNDL